jgi:hypothetical protein
MQSTLSIGEFSQVMRSLVQRPAAPISVQHRTVPATRALAISETVTRAELLGWWTATFEEIHAVLGDRDRDRDRDRELEPAGPAGARFAGELFEQEVGDVVVFIPTHRHPPDDTQWETEIGWPIFPTAHH